jgi:ATP-dependent Clp protease ATP-binding subunit ClpB
MQIEAEALKKEDDAASKDRLEKLEKELSDLQQQSAEMTAKWQAERDKLDAARTPAGEAGPCAGGTGPGQAGRGSGQGRGAVLRRDPAAGESSWPRPRNRTSDVMVDEAVRPEQIAEVVERWTGVPVAKMLEGEKEKLLRMEDELHKRVIGQRQAVDAVSRAVRRARAGCRTRTVRWARSCSSGRPASARPS